jgi:hypothetical protein
MPGPLKDILNFKIPNWSSGKIKDVSLVARYRQFRTAYIGSTVLFAPGLSLVSRPAVHFLIKDSGSGRWIIHRPSWTRLSETSGRKQIKYKGRSFENSQHGLKQLVAGLVLTVNPFKRPRLEFLPDSGPVDVRIIDPFNHTDLLARAVTNGPPESEQSLLNLLPAFDCLPLRKGDYEVSLKLKNPLHFISRNDVLSLRTSTRENLELLSLNLEVERK